METLSALAIVAQQAIPDHAVVACKKSILKAELERTRLDYERSHMVAEDRFQTQVRHTIDNMRDRYELTVMFLSQEVEENTRDLEETKDHVHDLQKLIYTLEDNIGNLERELGETPIEQLCLVHTRPIDTEINDRRKFMRLLKC